MGGLGRLSRLGHSHHHYHEEGSRVASRTRGKAGLLPWGQQLSPLCPQHVLETRGGRRVGGDWQSLLAGS